MEQTEVEDYLEPCYYCEEPPIVEPWHGGSPTKHMVSCVNDYCDLSPNVTGNTKAEAIERWNHRPLEIIAKAKGKLEGLKIIRKQLSRGGPYEEIVIDAINMIDELTKEKK